MLFMLQASIRVVTAVTAVAVLAAILLPLQLLTLVPRLVEAAIKR